MEEKKEKNDGLRFYNVLRSVPDSAIKTIKGGRLAGMSDINPVWRIKAMTETFGPCGIGWKYEITKQWQENFGQEVKVHTNVNLYIRADGEWSSAIPGTGGATAVEVSAKGVYVNDECYKMALTDALSVAMKSLGVGADVYFSKGRDLETKYSNEESVRSGSVPSKGIESAIMEMKKASSTSALMEIYSKYAFLQSNSEFINALTLRKKEILEDNGTAKA